MCERYFNKYTRERLTIQTELMIYLMTSCELNEEKNVLIADWRRLAQCAITDIFTLGLYYLTQVYLCVSL